jgi:regulator of sigma E protease
VSYLLAFLGFAALIILHEAGHFAAAKAVGMRVERFSLFFGPMFIKKRIGETDYGIGPIPLGGYVRITGMNPNEDIPPEAVPRAYYNQPVWKRVVVILAGPAVNLLIALLLLIGLAIAQGQPRVSHGQVVYSNRVEALIPPASDYLKPGDRIVSVDGRTGLTEVQITKEIRTHRCAGTPAADCRAKTPVRLTVDRDGRHLAFSIYPIYSLSSRQMRLGFSVPAEMVPVSFGQSVSSSLSYMWYVTQTTVTKIVRIFQPQDRRQIHGIVGGYATTQAEFAHSTFDALLLLALISLSLAVVNLFPFLPLDGGHVFWAVAEKVRGRRIPFAVMERAGIVGFALILLLFAIGLSNDISTLNGPGFGPR